MILYKFYIVWFIQKLEKANFYMTCRNSSFYMVLYIKTAF